ncbi:hypothetical protein AB1L88_11745 [Tautonia sp. JC769]|uniref:hypothetical protein n=1 Tax=Tautonia sp. JC769 TaxID=3232135 RepID=UPI00345AC9B0
MKTTTKCNILSFCEEHLRDFGPPLAAETLAEVGLQVGLETLRRWLTAEGLWQPAPRPDTHRTRRPRRACFGELIQLDASIHEWTEGRGEAMALSAMIDDATGRVLARFAPAEIPDHVLRNVTENRRTMRFHDFGFEEESPRGVSHGHVGSGGNCSCRSWSSKTRTAAEVGSVMPVSTVSIPIVSRRGQAVGPRPPLRRGPIDRERVRRPRSTRVRVWGRACVPRPSVGRRRRRPA